MHARQVDRAECEQQCPEREGADCHARQRDYGYQKLGRERKEFPEPAAHEDGQGLAAHDEIALDIVQVVVQGTVENQHEDERECEKSGAVGPARGPFGLEPGQADAHHGPGERYPHVLGERDVLELAVAQEGQVVPGQKRHMVEDAGHAGDDNEGEFGTTQPEGEGHGRQPGGQAEQHGKTPVFQDQVGLEYFLELVGADVGDAVQDIHGVDIQRGHQEIGQPQGVRNQVVVLQVGGGPGHQDRGERQIPVEGHEHVDGRVQPAHRGRPAAVADGLQVIRHAVQQPRRRGRARHHSHAFQSFKIRGRQFAFRFDMEDARVVAPCDDCQARGVGAVFPAHHHHGVRLAGKRLHLGLAAVRGPADRVVNGRVRETGRGGVFDCLVLPEALGGLRHEAYPFLRGEGRKVFRRMDEPSPAARVPQQSHDLRVPRIAEDKDGAPLAGVFVKDVVDALDMGASGVDDVEPAVVERPAHLRGHAVRADDHGGGPNLRGRGRQGDPFFPQQFHGLRVVDEGPQGLDGLVQFVRGLEDGVHGHAHAHAEAGMAGNDDFHRAGSFPESSSARIFFMAGLYPVTLK